MALGVWVCSVFAVGPFFITSNKSSHLLKAGQVVPGRTGDLSVDVKLWSSEEPWKASPTGKEGPRAEGSAQGPSARETRGQWSGPSICGPPAALPPPALPGVCAQGRGPCPCFLGCVHRDRDPARASWVCAGTQGSSYPVPYGCICRDPEFCLRPVPSLPSCKVWRIVWSTWSRLPVGHKDCGWPPSVL